MTMQLFPAKYVFSVYWFNRKPDKQYKTYVKDVNNQKHLDNIYSYYEKHGGKVLDHEMYVEKIDLDQEISISEVLVIFTNAKKMSSSIQVPFIKLTGTLSKSEFKDEILRSSELIKQLYNRTECSIEVLFLINEHQMKALFVDQFNEIGIKLQHLLLN